MLMVRYATDNRPMLQYSVLIGRGWGLAMPRYFFALNNEPPENETVEDFPSDAAARKHATKIAIEIWHNRKGGPLPVSTYNERGERLGKTLVIEDGTTVIPLSRSAIFAPPLRRTSNDAGNLRVPVPEKRQGKGEQELRADSGHVEA
jgi:hypothetical protein